MQKVTVSFLPHCCLQLLVARYMWANLGGGREKKKRIKKEA